MAWQGVERLGSQPRRERREGLVMKVEIGEGEAVTVVFKDTDGEITVRWDPGALRVLADLPDTEGREGVIYEERWNTAEPDGEKEPEPMTPPRVVRVPACCPAMTVESTWVHCPKHGRRQVGKQL